MSVTPMSSEVVLEPAAQAFAEATAAPPFLYELTPDEARAVLDDVQAAPIAKLPVDEVDHRPRRRRRRPRPDRATRGCSRAAARRAVHARRRVGPRQRRHP